MRRHNQILPGRIGKRRREIFALDWPDPELPPAPVSYYFLSPEIFDRSVIEDFYADLRIDLARRVSKQLVVIDSWNNLSTVENFFTAEPFRKVLPLRGEPD